MAELPVVYYMFVSASGAVAYEPKSVKSVDLL